MTNVDQFESVFRAAAKTQFEFERVGVRSVLLVTDRDADGAAAFAASMRGFLRVLETDEPAWTVIHGDQFATVRDALDLVESHQPDLVVTYRNLHTDGWRWPFTLGDHLEVLTQATTVPVLVVPHPEVAASDHALQDTNVVMAITDHLTGDHRLVNWAVRFTETDGTLFLAHVEDDAQFDRTVGVISRIPEIDTDVARETMREQLLREPRDYVTSARRVLEEAGARLRVEEMVTMGHRLATYRAVVEEHRVDLLVLNTKDDEQLAMHGIAYPLAVELRSVPLLML